MSRLRDTVQLKKGAPLPNTYLVVGIDPGTSTGWAEYSPITGELESVDTIDFHAVMERARGMERGTVLFIVEDPSQNPFFVERYILPQYRRRRSLPMEEVKRLCKIAGNTGGNGKEALMLIEGLKGMGHRVRAVRPTSQKWTSHMFMNITGWDKRCSQHARDAAKLCFGIKR